MDTSTHLVRLENWKALVESCNARPLGQTKREWLRENGINEKLFYYYQRRIREQAFDQMLENIAAPAGSSEAAVSFAEIKLTRSADRTEPSKQPDAVIQTARGTVAFSNTVSSELLRQVMEVMLHA